MTDPTPAGLNGVGCQTFTWQMLGPAWAGTTTDILDAVAAAGDAGLELTLAIAGEFRDDPVALRAACAARGLTLTTLAFSTPTGFTDPAHAAAELAAGEAAVAWAVAAGCATFGLGGAALPDGGDRVTALRQAATVYNALAEMAGAAGLVAHLHPSSHHGSVIATEAEYEAILARTDPRLVRFGPDTGHLLRGGIDPVAFLKRHLARVVHVHLKDVDAAGAWALLGQGICPIGGVLDLLRATDYRGWVMLEEEADAARAGPAAAVARNRAWLRATFGW
ncbi:MAG: TIM barrel protein [Chloroflexi bacterium]|nr:TIM barrel protein [Chloroflexota bacterium]